LADAWYIYEAQSDDLGAEWEDFKGSLTVEELGAYAAARAVAAECGDDISDLPPLEVLRSWRCDAESALVVDGSTGQMQLHI